MKLAAAVWIVALALGDPRPVYFAGEHDPGKPIRGTTLTMSPRESGWAEMLAQLKEPPLCCASEKSAEHYRFTWLRTFHHPIVINVLKLDELRWRVTVKVGSGKSGFDFDDIKILREDARMVPTEALKPLLRSFEKSSAFWSLPRTNDDMGSDGATWLIEARREGVHHYAGRWSPEDGSVREIGLQFLDISGLELEPDSIY